MYLWNEEKDLVQIQYKIRQAIKYSNTKGMEIQTNIYLYSFAFFLSNAKCLTNYLTLDTNLASYEWVCGLFYGLGGLLLGVKTDSSNCT